MVIKFYLPNSQDDIFATIDMRHCFAHRSNNQSSEHCSRAIESCCCPICLSNTRLLSFSFRESLVLRMIFCSSSIFTAVRGSNVSVSLSNPLSFTESIYYISLNHLQEYNWGWLRLWISTDLAGDDFIATLLGSPIWKGDAHLYPVFSVYIDMAPLGIWMPSRVTTSRARNPAVHIRGGCSLVAWLCQVTQRLASSDDMLLRTIMYVTGAGPMFLRFPVLYLYSISRNFCVRGRFPALQERLLCCPQSLLFFYSHSSAF